MDSTIRLCTAAAVDNTVSIRTVTSERPPSPVGTRAAEALEPAPYRGPSIKDGEDGVLPQRQRIDMTRPATMRPKPMAKFHALSEDMNGICSPAT